MRVFSKDGNYLSTIFTIVFFLLFYFNNETLPNNLSSSVSQPCMYVAIFELILFTVIAVTRRGVFSRNGLSFLIAFFLVLLVMLGGIIDIAFSNGYFLLAMNIMVAVTMVSLIPYKIFIKYFIQLVVLFAGASLLITYILKPFIVGLPLPHAYNSSNVPFINAFLCYLVDYDGYIRNTGIFREAGVWGAILSIALMFLVSNKELFPKKASTYFYIIIIASIFSTFSTTALLATAMIYVVIFFNKPNRSSQSFLFIILLVIVFFFFSRYSIFVDEFDFAVDKLSTNSSSYQARTEIIKNAIPIMFHNPLGLGIINGTEALTISNTLVAYHNTSTFVAGGVYFGLLYLLIYVILLFLFCKKRVGYWLLIIPMALLLQGEQYIFNPWFYMFLFYGIKTDSNYEKSVFKQAIIQNQNNG